MDIITEDNFILFCAQNYDGRHCSSTEDFYDDISRLKYIRKLVTRYLNGDELKERLILNHIIVLNNVFGPEAAVRILYFKLEDQFQYIKPFLVLLKILPKYIKNVNKEGYIHTDLIEMDPGIIEALRKI
jgi:hypothetical protein